MIENIGKNMKKFKKMEIIDNRTRTRRRFFETNSSKTFLLQRLGGVIQIICVYIYIYIHVMIYT